MTKPCPACGRPLAGGLHDVCLSEDRRLRYWLEVEIPSGGEPAATCAFLMLNPSAADESATDQTVRRCVGFAERAGYGRLVIVNLFASRSPNPQTLSTGADPVGADNDAHIREALRQAAVVACAWGNWGNRAAPRVIEVGEMLLAEGCRKKLRTLGDLTDGGHPPHPGRLAYERELRPWLDFEAWLEGRKRPA